MKCPKCGYLGFEPVDRCRNCGYDFSLLPSLDLPELPLRGDDKDMNPLDDLALIDAAVPSLTDMAALPSFMDVTKEPPRSQAPTGELPLFGSVGDDVPLITKASPPRTPLAVRRATPDVPRLRSSAQPRPAMLDLSGFDPPFSPAAPAAREPVRNWGALPDAAYAEPAGAGARLTAAIIDVLILAGIDAVVIYLTMQICGLTLDDLRILPKGPLLAFLVTQNLGYLVTFTVGGQTLGKMAVGIKVVSARDDAALDFVHALVRTAVWVVLAVPAGLGFLTTLFSADRRGLHDRCAGTKVVRASA